MASATEPADEEEEEEGEEERADREVRSSLNFLPKLVLSQVSGRVLTFILNGILLRYVSRDSLGIINVRLLLIYSSVQFMSREPFRRSVSRNDIESNLQSTVTFIYTALPLCLIIGSVFYVIWTSGMLTSPDPVSFPGYEVSVLLMVTSVLIEMTAEPLFIYAQIKSRFTVRIIAETLALLIRCLCLLTFLLIHSGNDDADDATTTTTVVKDGSGGAAASGERSGSNILMAFAGGQVAGSVCYTAVFWIHFYRQPNFPTHAFRPTIPLVMTLPQPPPPLPIRGSLKRTTLTFLKQTVVKQLLTEGEKFVMTIFDVVKFADQGVYDVVNNLSSLAARFLLAPMEETAYHMFCKLIDRSKGGAGHQEPGCVRKAGQLLERLVRVVALLGAMIFVFGFNFAQLCLLIYAGRDFTERSNAVSLLRWQTLYILIIAVNGVTESFSVACMHPTQLDSFNRTLVLLSILLTSSSLVLTRFLSSTGFLVANSLNMFCRILHSLHFIRKYFSTLPDDTVAQDGSSFRLRSLFPAPVLILTLSLMFAVMRVSEQLLCCTHTVGTMVHVLIGAFLFLIFVYLMFRRERDLVQYFASAFFSKRLKSEKRD